MIDVAVEILGTDGLSKEQKDRMLTDAFAHQRWMERRQTWLTGLGMCLPLIFSLITAAVSIVAYFHGQTLVAGIGTGAVGVTGGAVVGSDRIRRRAAQRGESAGGQGTPKPSG